MLSGVLLLLAATPHLAIAPFANPGGDAAVEPLCRGFADTLITDLSQLPELQVIERARLNVVLRELELWNSPLVDPASVKRLGARLAADLLLTGSITVRDDSLTVTARIVYVKSGRVLASRTVEGARAQVFALEKDIAELLVEALALKLSVSERSALRKARGKSWEEFVAYSEGLDALDRGDEASAKKHFDAASGDPLFRAIAFTSLRFKHGASAFTPEDQAEFDAQVRALNPAHKSLGDILRYLLGATMGPDAGQVANLLVLAQWVFDRDVSPSSGAEVTLYTCLLTHIESDPEFAPQVPAVYEYLLHRYPTDASLAEQVRRYRAHGLSKWQSEALAPNREGFRRLINGVVARTKREHGGAP